MTYSKRYIYPRRFEVAGHNQHGTRYREISSQQVTCVRLEAQFDSARDLANLVYMSSFLGIPIQWDTKSDPQVAFIEIVSVDSLQKAGIT